jgi:hypothetical protein
MHSNRPVQPPGCRINASSSVHLPRRGWSVRPDRWPHPCAGSRRLGRPAANSSRAPGDLGGRHVHPQEAGLDGAWHQCLELWGRSEDVFRSVHLLHDIEPRPRDPAAARASRIHCVETTSIAQHNGRPTSGQREVMVRQAAEPAATSATGVRGSAARSGYRAVISRTAGPSRARRPIVTECAHLSTPFEESRISRNLCQETSGRASA